jgi:hypothetical protein
MMMMFRSRRLADQLDAAIDGRCPDLPGELVPLLAIAQAIRDAARRDPSTVLLAICSPGPSCPAGP